MTTSRCRPWHSLHFSLPHSPSTTTTGKFAPRINQLQHCKLLPSVSYFPMLFSCTELNIY